MHWPSVRFQHCGNPRFGLFETIPTCTPVFKLTWARDAVSDPSQDGLQWPLLQGLMAGI